MAKRILFVDDDPNLIEVLQIRFKAEGYEVFVASDGNEALLKMRAENPDLIVMDVAMPKMDGYAVVKEMKADDALKGIPVLIVSGKDSMKEIFEMEGIQEFLVKPVEFDSLLVKVKDLLGET